MPTISNSLRSQLLLALAMMLFGLALVVQLRSYERLTERLETESEADLVEIIDRLDTEIRLIRGELTDRQIKLAEYDHSSGDSAVLINKANQEIGTLKMLIGLAPASGPGIIITIKDKQRLLTGFDFRQIIEELRASGAWAVSVNSLRLEDKASFWRRRGTVYLNGVKLGPEVNIKAIGDVNLLYQAITLPRGIRDTLATLQGVSVVVQRADKIIVPTTRANVKL